MPSKSLESEVNDSLVFLKNMGKLKIENGFIEKIKIKIKI